MLDRGKEAEFYNPGSVQNLFSPFSSDTLCAQPGGGGYTFAGL